MQHASKLAMFKASQLQKTLTLTPKQLVANRDLVFGKTFTDHMLTVDFDQAKNGWQQPEIAPYSKLQLDPSAVVFHYGMEVFEGMKAYKDTRGQIRLFRPDMNMKRMLKSCKRLALPEFDMNQLLECIKELVRVDERWIPAERGYSLYIRPTAIASQETLGVAPSSKAKLFVIACPVGPYYKTGFAAVSLLADPDRIRAWPGGVGDCKVGGNYAPGILPQLYAANLGFQQNLWLFPTRDGDDHYITEVGTMNCFVVWKNEKGERELATPPLDGTILPGVTRDSILKLAAKMSDLKVSERPITMKQLITASNEGRLIEMFGSGTAAIVSPIKQVRYLTRKNSEGEPEKWVDLNVPLDPANPKSQAGPLTLEFSKQIMAIQYGEVEHEWSVVV